MYTKVVEKVYSVLDTFLCITFHDSICTLQPSKVGIMVIATWWPSALWPDLQGSKAA